MGCGASSAVAPHAAAPALAPAAVDGQKIAVAGESPEALRKPQRSSEATNSDCNSNCGTNCATSSCPSDCNSFHARDASSPGATPEPLRNHILAPPDSPRVLADDAPPPAPDLRRRFLHAPKPKTRRASKDSQASSKQARSRRASRPSSEWSAGERRQSAVSSDAGAAADHDRPRKSDASEPRLSTASRRSSGAFSVQGEFRPRRSSADDGEDDDVWGNDEQPSHAQTHVPSPMQTRAFPPDSVPSPMNLASRKSSCAA